MTTPYNYIQIVDDDGWGLVGIIPNDDNKEALTQITRDVDSQTHTDKKIIQRPIVNNIKSSQSEYEHKLQLTSTAVDDSFRLSLNTKPRLLNFIPNDLSVQMTPVESTVCSALLTSNHDYDTIVGITPEYTVSLPAADKSLHKLLPSSNTETKASVSNSKNKSSLFSSSNTEASVSKQVMTYPSDKFTILSRTAPKDSVLTGFNKYITQQ